MSHNPESGVSNLTVVAARCVLALCSGKPFVFRDQTHYELLGNAVTSHIQSLMESRFGMRRVPLVLSFPGLKFPKHEADLLSAASAAAIAAVAAPIAASYLFVSADFYCNIDKMVVLIQGMGAVR